MPQNIWTPPFVVEFPYLLEADKYNPSKAVYSVNMKISSPNYMKLIHSVRKCIGASYNSVDESNDGYVVMDSMKWFRRKPSHAKSDSNNFFIKAQCKEMMLDKSNQPKLYDVKGKNLYEQIQKNTDVRGCIASALIRPTPFRKLGVISSVLLEVKILAWTQGEWEIVKPQLEEKEKKDLEHLEDSSVFLDDDIALDQKIQEGDKAFIEKLDKSVGAEGKSL